MNIFVFGGKRCDVFSKLKNEVMRLTDAAGLVMLMLRKYSMLNFAGSDWFHIGHGSLGGWSGGIVGSAILPFSTQCQRRKKKPEIDRNCN